MKTRKNEAEKVYGVVSDGVLTRTVQRKRHFFWQYGGYAIGEQTATRQDWQVMNVDETDTGKHYTVTRSEFEARSKMIETTYGTQYVLNIKYFQEI